MTRLAIPALLLAPFLATAALAQAEGPAAPSEIVSAASAERSVSADLATVTLRFARIGATPAEAGRNLALKADSVRRALASLGVSPDSVVNGSRWYWWRQRIEIVERPGRREEVYATDANGRRYVSHHVQHQDTVYRAHEQLLVRIRDINRVGRVIDAALAQGITDISEVSFSATDTEAAQREAVRQATERARARAEVVAAAGGGRLGRTLRLSTEGSGEPVRHVPFSLVSLDGVVATGAAAGAAETVVVAPVLKVTATVHGRWEFVETR